MRKRFKALSYLAALLVIDIIFFGYVNPNKTYALVVIIGFGLLVLTLYVIVDLLLTLLEKLLPLSVLTRKRLLSSITMLLALLIAMQSIGQLTGKDMFAIVPLVVVLAFYLSYQSKESRQKR